MRRTSGVVVTALAMAVAIVLAVHVGSGAGRAMEGPGAELRPALAASAGVAEPAASVQANGRSIFERKGNCATCHGRNGRGTPLAPDLTDGEWLNITGTFEEIVAIVRAGVAEPMAYPAPMPPMGGARLSAEEIEAVAAYVFSLRPKSG
jgi:mono/diheme cytochrome c family protein